jgi:hypothetical protein
MFGCDVCGGSKIIPMHVINQTVKTPFWVLILSPIDLIKLFVFLSISLMSLSEKESL